MSENYFDIVRPTYIENWPAGLREHSIRTLLLPITPDQVQGLIAINYMTLEDGRVPTEEEVNSVESLIPMVDLYLKKVNGAFIRLGSRSPKDSWKGYKSGFFCTTGKGAIELLADSERIYEDLYLAMNQRYIPYLAVREWIDIKSWQEFRCFFIDRKLVGISQYNYQKDAVYPEIEIHAAEIERSIRAKSHMIAQLLPADNVVLDYVIQDNGEVVLLECNPFSMYTDPCLFNWKEGFHDFEFRFKKAV